MKKQTPATFAAGWIPVSPGHFIMLQIVVWKLILFPGHSQAPNSLQLLQSKPLVQATQESIALVSYPNLTFAPCAALAILRLSSRAFTTGALKLHVNDSPSVAKRLKSISCSDVQRIKVASQDHNSKLIIRCGALNAGNTLVRSSDASMEILTSESEIFIKKLVNELLDGLHAG